MTKTCEKNCCKDQKLNLKNLFFFKGWVGGTNTCYSWCFCFFFTLTSLQTAHLNFFPLGHTYGVFHYTCDGFFIVHKAVKRLSHVRVGMFFLWSRVKYTPQLTWLSDWLTGRPSVVCVCVVLLCSKSNWMIRQCVFYNMVSFLFECNGTM